MLNTAKYAIFHRVPEVNKLSWLFFEHESYKGVNLSLSLFWARRDFMGPPQYKPNPAGGDTFALSGKFHEISATQSPKEIFVFINSVLKQVKPGTSVNH